MSDDPLGEAYQVLRVLLDEGGHEDTCVLRCLREECEDDHHCCACTDE